MADFWWLYIIFAYFGDFQRFAKIKIAEFDKYIVYMNKNEFAKILSTIIT